MEEPPVDFWQNPPACHWKTLEREFLFVYGGFFLETITSLFFYPPMAIGRLGESGTPLESFKWGTDPTIHGNNKTVIKPDVTFEVLPDGSIRPYIPESIRFSDHGKIRPVAPFFELWVTVEEYDETAPDRVHRSEKPLTLGMLRRNRIDMDSLSFQVEAANHKAYRRTGDICNSFRSHLQVSGSDHRKHVLQAVSPHNPGEEPLVTAENPIPLGSFQVIRPDLYRSMGCDLSVVRVRYTPAKGDVYGPPTAVSGPAPVSNRIYEIVKAENRILNPKATWCHYDANFNKYNNPDPFDTYDGADIGSNRSWGVVDETCDLILKATLYLDGRSYSAMARAFAAPPDYAPDKRPFLSMADELADRDLPPVKVDAQEYSISMEEIVDLFERVAETSDLINLDAIRNYQIGFNQGVGQAHNDWSPKTGTESMTKFDKGYVDQIPDLIAPVSPENPTPYTEALHAVHPPLGDFDDLMDFLATNATHVKKLMRPPYGRFRQLPEHAKSDGDPGKEFRDPRVIRDTVQDMRMPPYMRDSDSTGLSLTYRQYHQLMDLVDLLGKVPPETPLKKKIQETYQRTQTGNHPAN